MRSTIAQTIWDFVNSHNDRAFAMFAYRPPRRLVAPALRSGFVIAVTAMKKITPCFGILANIPYASEQTAAGIGARLTVMTQNNKATELMPAPRMHTPIQPAMA